MAYKGGGREAARYYFQDAAIRGALERIASPGEKNNRVLLSLATGTGKTVIATQLLYKLAQASQLRRALFVCDRDELRTQASQSFKGCSATTQSRYDKRSGNQCTDSRRVVPDAEHHRRRRRAALSARQLSARALLPTRTRWRPPT